MNSPNTSPAILHVENDAWSFYMLNRKKYITYLQNSLRISLKEVQNMSFETKDRTDIPYIFRWEKLYHRQARNLEKRYPDNIKLALAILYNQYVEEYEQLVKQSGNTYPSAFSLSGNLVIPFIQIDMVYLPSSFLRSIQDCDPTILADVLRPFIFEIESSVAYYEFLSKINIWVPYNTSWFWLWLRLGIDDIRMRTGKKVALLVTSSTKYQSIKELEFWINWSLFIDDLTVKIKSGFDALLSPDEFREYYEGIQKWKTSDTLFYVRASSDTQDFKDQKESRNILQNEEYRDFIRSNSITVNIDSPDTAFPLNDTKRYMRNMWLGLPFTSIDEIIPIWVLECVRNNNDFSSFSWPYYTPKVQEYLRSVWVGEDDIAEWKLVFRCKPIEWSYGAYGHVRLNIQDAKSRRKLRDAMKNGGSYLLQIENQSPTIINDKSQKEYKAIDRIFMRMDRDGNISFLEGFINAIPSDSDEAKKNNIHGSRLTEYWYIS